MSKTLEDADITLVSTTESEADLRKDLGQEPERTEEPRGEEGQREQAQKPGEPRITRDWRQPGHVPHSVQKRFNDLTGRAKAAEYRAQQAETELARLRGGTPAESQNRGTEAGPANGGVRPNDENGTRSSNRVQEVRTRHADFDETISSVAHIDIGERAVGVARELSNAPEVAYVLGKMIKADPTIADRMRANPEWAVAEIHKLSADVSRIEGGSQLERHPAFREHALRVDEHLKREPLTDAEKTAAVNMPVTPAMQHAILELPNSVEVTRYIVRHPDIYQRWKGMATEAAVLADIGRISARLEGNGNRQRPTSQAPAPTVPEKGGHTMARDLSDDNMSTDEYIRRRNADERQRRGK